MQNALSLDSSQKKNPFLPLSPGGIVGQQQAWVYTGVYASCVMSRWLIWKDLVEGVLVPETATLITQSRVEVREPLFEHDWVESIEIERLGGENIGVLERILVERDVAVEDVEEVHRVRRLG